MRQNMIRTAGRARTNAKQNRRGFLTLELLLVLPILMLLLMGLFEFSLLFLAQADVTEASRVATRVASLNGVTQSEVQEAALRALGPRLATPARVQTALAANSGEEVAVTVIVPRSAAAPDLLWPIGLGLRGEQIVCTTRMVKE